MKKKENCKKLYSLSSTSCCCFPLFSSSPRSGRERTGPPSCGGPGRRGSRVSRSYSSGSRSTSSSSSSPTAHLATSSSSPPPWWWRPRSCKRPPRRTRSRPRRRLQSRSCGSKSGRCTRSRSPPPLWPKPRRCRPRSPGLHLPSCACSGAGTSP